MSISKELAERLCAEVHGRVSRYHRNQSSIFITMEEMASLSEKYPTNVILTALTNAGSVVKNNPVIERKYFLGTVERLAERVLEQSHAKGASLHHKGKAQAESTVTPIRPVAPPKPTVDTDALRQHFQDNCTYSGDWTLATEDIEELLKVSNAKSLYEVFKAIGRFDSDYASQERCFTAIQEALDGLAWQNEQEALIIL